MKKNTGSLNAAKAAGLPAILLACGLLASISLSLAGCPMEVEEDGETRKSARSLPEDDYLDGALTSAAKEQWFKFTATASTHYIHVKHGTLSDFYVQLYDSNENAVGSKHNYHQSQLDGYGGWYTQVSVTRGKVYYLKVTPYYSSSIGTYQIGCNTTELAPGHLKTAKTLSMNTWLNGSIGDGGLYSFTATSATMYLHIKFGTLKQVYARLYDSGGHTLVNRTSLSGSGYFSYYLTSGSVYYVSLWSTSSTGSTYQVALSTSSTAP
jgi:hypothetical protein